MIITRAPFRISFFGGGTDVPAWFDHEGGQVLSTTIDKYCYVSLRHLPPFHDHTIRLAYSRLETVSMAEDVKHPLIRAILLEYGLNHIELHHDSDVPGRSGLGSSSSFAVGLISAIHALHGRLVSPRQLASEAIRIEREVLCEAGGYQDQIAAAFGGLNRIRFHLGGDWAIEPVPLSEQARHELNQHLLLFYLPTNRISAEVSIANRFSRSQFHASLKRIDASVDEAVSLLGTCDFAGFGALLHETWSIKREFDQVTNATIDQAYETARRAGALGGKLLGAGGGGFMLVFALPEQHASVIQSLKPLLHVPFAFANDGVSLLYHRT